jgi:AcrR family transcriptional regulator
LPIVTEVEVIPVSQYERTLSSRKDAQRNRQSLIDAATRALTSGDDVVKLETIARDAGVGVGTLYRNFPSREALVEEVYRSELARLCQSVDGLLAEHPPVDAARLWMRNYLDFVATKRGMAETLRAVIANGAITSSQTREHLNGAIRALLNAGIADGSLRDDVRPEDVSASLAGAMLASTDTDQAARMLDLLVDGLRANTAEPS